MAFLCYGRGGRLAIAWAALLPAALLGLYLFLIAPRASRREAWPEGMLQCAYAHRGLHRGPSVPENSLAAFERAAQAGFGIELDVRLSRDGVLMVHHDDTLERTCGVKKRFADLDAQEIRSYPLFGSQERIPDFSQVLSCVAGRSPLIVELKSMGKRNGELARKTCALLESYPGPWCVESFDPRLLLWFRRHAPQAIRGQLAYDPRRSEAKKKGLLYWAGANLLTNFLSRPDFIAYGQETDGNPSFQITKKLFRPVTAAWTVSTPETYQRLRRQYDLQIFEGFVPTDGRFHSKRS